MTGILHHLGVKYGTDKATHHQYLDFYEEHLPEKIDRLLEIGVMDGASLRMWREAYPMASEIVGVDIVKRRHVDGCTVLQVDATRPAALMNLGMFDVIIDDGSHLTHEQQASFAWLYPRQLKPGGIYIMEDIHTSFLPTYVTSPETTYDWLWRRKRDAGWDVEFFARNPDDLTDSVTAIIRKPE